MHPAIIVFSLYFLATPTSPESTWFLNSQYRTEMACNFVGAMKQAQLKQMGLPLTYVCQASLR